MQKTLNLKAAKKTKLYEEIVHQIEALIHRGDLKSGDQLPPERRLAEVFKVSRNSVREAIRALEEKKLLQSRPGDGTYVILKEKQTLIGQLAGVIQQEHEKLQEIFEFRRLIEPQISYLAAENASAADIDNLKSILQKQKENIDSGKINVEEDKLFHLLLAQASKNVLFLKTVNILNNTLDESRSDFLQNETRQKSSLQAHQKILDAILSGDADSAKKQMNDHLIDVEQTVFALKHSNPT